MFRGCAEAGDCDVMIRVLGEDREDGKSESVGARGGMQLVD